MELCGKLATPQKGTQYIIDYMQGIKTTMEALALMNKPVDFEELSIRLLLGLGPSYKEISHALQVRDNPLTFDELFEKLLNYEA